MDFLNALINAKKRKQNIVIPDIKCYSPKEGDLMAGRNPVEYAKCLVRSGAPVLSVVTEEKEFHGSVKMLREIADAVDVPILRKDFIHTREDLIETKESGASAILLMCSCLEKEELKYLYEQALSLGLDPFVETHRKEDFELVRELGAKLVGINNRDITVLEKDNGNVSNTVSLAKYVPKGAFLVTESSIQNPKQVRQALEAGADAALVGTAILRAKYTESFYRMMCRKISLKVCGLMNEQDIELCVRLGVERIGMVVDYPLPVQWNLDAARAKELRKLIPQGYTACMVTGGSKEKIMELADAIRPDLVQIHYKENIADTKEIAEGLRLLGIDSVKSLPSTAESFTEQFGTSDLSQVIAMTNDSVIDELLIDPRHGSKVTNSNLSLDIELAKQAISFSKKPVIIAGGIKEDNLRDIYEKIPCRYVDVMNGTEDAPGKKNEEKIAKIIEILDELGY